MKTSRKFVLLATATGSLLSLGAPAPAFITFDQRENLNLLNSPDVTITSAVSTYDPAQWLRGHIGPIHDVSSSGIGWFTGHDVISSPPEEVLTIDLGAVRNIKTIRSDGAWNIRTAILETSADGVTWSGALSHGVTNFTGGSGNETKWVLDSAADAKWLRITGQTYDRALPAELGISSLRVYGDVGTVLADKGLDLVSSTGWTAGNATYSTTGTYTSIGGVADLTDDNHANLQGRQLTYYLNQGKTAQVVFDTTVEKIGRLGVTLGTFPNYIFGFSAQDTLNKTVDLDFWGSTDGVNFTTLLYSLTTDNVFGTGPNFFDLPVAFTGRGIRMEVVTAIGDPESNPSISLTDMFVFQVPEPASLSLLALGGAMMLRRRTR